MAGKLIKLACQGRTLACRKCDERAYLEDVKPLTRIEGGKEISFVSCFSMECGGEIVIAEQILAPLNSRIAAAQPYLH